MNTSGYSRIPSELFYWITFLSKGIPLRSVGTFIELLIGAMLTSTGFVTDVYMMMDMSRHWSSYYKWLQKGRWSWLGLASQFVRLALQVIKEDAVYLAIDDTLTLRASKKAPGSQIHHQHGNKPNLTQYVRGQCWVSLAWVVKLSDSRHVALPLLTRLIPSVSNTGKLVAANTLIRAIYRLFLGKTVRVLVDSWYMRKRFIQAICQHGFAVIGQVRIDTRLYDEPVEKRKKTRGRPRKYGDQYTAKRIAHLKRTEVTLPLYGKEQVVRYRSKVVKVRFLDGQQVRAVWVEFKADNGEWKKASLLLSTDASLSPEDVIESYGKRWSIESMFNQLKLSWGLKEAWQQTRQTLHRWVHITMVGYGLIQLLAYENTKTVQQLCHHSPWRRDNPVTAGQIRKGLQLNFRHVNVRAWWNRTCKKFQPPDWRGSEENEHEMLNA